MVKNYFEVLGLKPGASEDDIKKTFRTLARQWHPDKNNAPTAEEKFKEINSAYDYLKSKDRREMLERELLRPKPPPEEKCTTNKTKTSQSEGTSFFGTKRNFNDTSDGRDFGKYSYERYQESNFDTFDARPKASESNTSNKSSKERKKKTKSKQKPWSQKWNSETTYGDDEDFVFGKKPPFSFAFNSFVDELDSTFGLFNVNFNLGPPGFSSFFGDEDPFRDFMYQDPSLNMGQPKKPSPSRKRFVAPETGKAEGLNEEYMFTSRSGKTNSDIPYTTSDEDQGFGWDSGAETDESDGNYNNKRFRCVYCGRRFTIDRLANHETGCAKRHGRWTFSDDENEGEEEENEDQFSRAPGDWRQTHEDLIRHIRQARREARTRKWQESDWREEEHWVTCEWCGRKFNQVVANRHIPICKTLNKATGPAFASKAKTTSTDKARDRAKEYSRHIPKPKKKSGEEANSTHTGKTGSTFPDLGSSRRSSYSKSQPASSTGLNGSTTKPTRGTAKPEKTRKPYRDREKEPAPNDSSGIGIHGEGLKGTSRSHGEGCPTCARKYGPNAKFTCSCGVKNTRA